METASLIKLFRNTAEIDAFVPAYEEFLADKPAARAWLHEQLGEFLAEPQRLAEEEDRRLLAHLFLLTGMSAATDEYPALLKLTSLPEFDANVKSEDWLYCELSRLFGLLAPAGEMPQLRAKVLAAETAPALREQLVMTMVFRWLCENEKDREFASELKTIMETLPPSQVDFELGMALVVNAIAAGGDTLRETVMNFFHANEEKLKDKLPEKSINNFFGLGRQRIKSMLRGNCLGGYSDNIPGELSRMLNFPPEEEIPSAAPKSLPPIHREHPKVGRNEPCPCGSGKKYKNCCGK